MKKITILGSTGSIGVQTLEVAQNLVMKFWL
jgi:1-deoxy-D-xylulose 5-phosphate reductoisomerase